MRHLVVAFAAGLLLACGALDTFDPPPPPLLVDAAVRQADYPVCIRVNPGPLIKPKKPVLYPHHSELS
jgi:hypothetical protein